MSLLDLVRLKKSPIVALRLRSLFLGLPASSPRASSVSALDLLRLGLTGETSTPLRRLSATMALKLDDSGAMSGPGRICDIV